MVNKKQLSVASSQFSVKVLAFLFVFLLATDHCQLRTVFAAQQPQSQPIYSVNAKAVQGVGPATWTYGADVGIYVSTTGNDTTGAGTSGNPYKTIGRALQDVPVFVSQHYIISLAAGTYREEVDVAGRYFGTNDVGNIAKAAIHIKGDINAPDSYVISGANAGAPTTAVRAFGVACTFANCLLEGVSIQYTTTAGLLLRGANLASYNITLRHHQNSSSFAAGIWAQLGSFYEEHGTLTIDDVQNGMYLEHWSYMTDPPARDSMFNTGWPVNSGVTITNVNPSGSQLGAGVLLLYGGFYNVSGNITVSGVQTANSYAVWGWEFPYFVAGGCTFSDFPTAVFGESQTQIYCDSGTISNSTVGVELHDQSTMNWASQLPTFNNVTTQYSISKDAYVITPTEAFSDGVIKSLGAVQISAGGTNQNITLTPSGTGNVSIGADRVLDFPAEGLSIPKIHLFGTTYGFGMDASDAVSFFGQYGGFSFKTTSVSGPLIARLISTGLGIGKSPGANAQLDVAKSIVSGLNVVTFSATPTFDASLGNTQKITLTANVTSSTLSNATAGETINFLICQDATGNRTFTWPSNFVNAPAINTATNSCKGAGFAFDGSQAVHLE